MHSILFLKVTEHNSRKKIPGPQHLPVIVPAPQTLNRIQAKTKLWGFPKTCLWIRKKPSSLRV